MPTTTARRAPRLRRSRRRSIACSRTTSIDIDASRTGGLLELRFPAGGTIVINTQPPLHELWLAAPSGGYHFRASEAVGSTAATAGEFFAVLSAAASELGGAALRFEP